MQEEPFLESALSAAVAAGIAIISTPRADLHIGSKQDQSPVTAADLAAQTKIRQRLESTGIPILSEEENEVDYQIRQHWKQLWLIDPLDGTKEYIAGRNEYTVNIALIENEDPIMGVIYAPALRLLYFGRAGIGSFRIHLSDPVTNPFDILQIQQRAVRLPDQRPTKLPRIIASRSHLNEATQQYISEFTSKFPGALTVNKGSSIKFCSLAEGSAELYPRFAPTMEWDTAAGDAILRAAGGGCKTRESLVNLKYNKPQLNNPDFIAYNASFQDEINPR